GLELSHSLPTDQGLLVLLARHEGFRGGRVLLDGLGVLVLLLEQESVARLAIRGLREGLQEARVESNRPRFFVRIMETVEQQAVILRGALRLVQARIEVAQSKQGLQVVRGHLQNAQISV